MNTNKFLSVFFNNSLMRGIAALPLGIALVIAGLLPAPRVDANDVNVHPSACAAPFLYQAEPMRWHEHFLMNPLGNVTTWVICPLTFDREEATFPNPGSSTIYLGGGVMQGAPNDSPLCFFAATDIANLNQGTYLNVPGANRSFVQNLPVTKAPPSWAVNFVGINHAPIYTALGGPGTTPYRWNLAVFCELPPGHSITTIQAFF